MKPFMFLNLGKALVTNALTSLLKNELTSSIKLEILSSLISSALMA